MRTTIALGAGMRCGPADATAQSRDVSSFIAGTAEDSLKSRAQAEPRPFRLNTVGGNGPLPGINLDRPRAIDEADDEARFGRGGV